MACRLRPRYATEEAAEDAGVTAVAGPIGPIGRDEVLIPG